MRNNYTSKEIETELDRDYCVDYIKEHAFILKNVLDRLTKVEKELKELKDLARTEAIVDYKYDEYFRKEEANETNN